LLNASVEAQALSQTTPVGAPPDPSNLQGHHAVSLIAGAPKGQGSQTPDSALVSVLLGGQHDDGASTGPQTHTAIADLTLKNSELGTTPHPRIDLSDPVDTGFDSLRFRATVQNQLLVDMTFTNPADADAYFQNRSISFDEFGIARSATYSVVLQVDLTTSGRSTGLSKVGSGGWALSAGSPSQSFLLDATVASSVPEPTIMALWSCGACLLIARRRRAAKDRPPVGISPKR
jgi:hypothetical protein